MKIHCIESKKEGFENKSFEELVEMVGWIEPPNDSDDTWDVTMSDECNFACKSQETAQIMAGIEEVKALLMEKQNA